MSTFSIITERRFFKFHTLMLDLCIFSFSFVNIWFYLLRLVEQLHFSDEPFHYEISHLRFLFWDNFEITEVTRAIQMNLIFLQFSELFQFCLLLISMPLTFFTENKSLQRLCTVLACHLSLVFLNLQKFYFFLTSHFQILWTTIYTRRRI